MSTSLTNFGILNGSSAQPEDTYDTLRKKFLIEAISYFVSSGGTSDPGVAQNGFSITPSDSAGLANTTRAILVGGAGTVKVDFAGGTAGVSITAVAGQLLPIAVTKVYNTGTSATGLVGLY